MMIQSKKELAQWISYERKLYACSDGKHYSNRKIYHYIVLLRKCEYLKNTLQGNIFKKVIFKLYDHRRRSLGLKLGYEMELNVFAKGLKIFHTGSLIVNGGTRVGENCTIIGSTCLGGKNGSDGPQIGANCELGINSIVIGNIKIADNVNIGAGAVVTKPILEAYSNVAGVPARIVSRNIPEVDGMKSNG